MQIYPDSLHLPSHTTRSQEISEKADRIRNVSNTAQIDIVVQYPHIAVNPATHRSPLPSTVVRTETPLGRHRWNFPTPLCSVQQRSLAKEVSLTHPSGDSRKYVHQEVEYSVRPSSIIRIVGLSYGFRIYARATTYWQISLQPFNEVSGEEPIFEFCRSGNVGGIETLLRLGKASLRDQDPLGRTPSWV